MIFIPKFQKIWSQKNSHYSGPKSSSRARSDHKFIIQIWRTFIIYIGSKNKIGYRYFDATYYTIGNEQSYLSKCTG